MNSDGADDRILEIVKLALRLLVHDFQVGDGRGAPRTPVHDVVAAIEQPLFIKPDERLAHRARKIVVHGEVFAAPIDGIANPLHLLDDRSAVVLLPLPDALDEGFAAHPEPVLSLRSQLPLDHHLGGDSGMIGARQPHASGIRACGASGR